MNPQAGGLMQMILTMLAGAGFKNVSEGTSKLAQTGGADQLFKLPNMPLFLAGAGLRDSANSMELIQPLLKMFAPPAPPENEVKPEETAAAMQALSMRLGPGLTGLQVQGGNPPMMR
jgi:hypothetical protein